MTNPKEGVRIWRITGEGIGPLYWDAETCGVMYGGKILKSPNYQNQPGVFFTDEKLREFAERVWEASREYKGVMVQAIGMES